ncbi:MAG: prepilin peptidase [Labilithrix sp.]|nr:prepilin peptidase [Labilithrix sp.]MCW5811880.1 prepilin peptidase [Labilithrix sp.]
MLLLVAALIGAVLGALGGKLADYLPTRYEITIHAPAAARQRRNAVLVVLSALVAAGIAHLLAEATAVAAWHRGVLFGVNVLLAVAVLVAAAIDHEHMILPNELTFGVAIVALLSSPLRHVGIAGAIAGAVLGLVIAHVPKAIYNRLRGISGAGTGDTKLVIAAGAWHGPEGAMFVLVAAALQSVLVALVMRALGVTYAVPESVRADIAKLRAAAEAGDEEAKAVLADDPMAAEEIDGALGMRVPLGPFLVLSCLEVLFLRRWLFA